MTSGKLSNPQQCTHRKPLLSLIAKFATNLPPISSLRVFTLSCNNNPNWVRKTSAKRLCYLRLHVWDRKTFQSQLMRNWRITTTRKTFKSTDMRNWRKTSTKLSFIAKMASSFWAVKLVTNHNLIRSDQSERKIAWWRVIARLSSESISIEVDVVKHGSIIHCWNCISRLMTVIKICLDCTEMDQIEWKGKKNPLWPLSSENVAI